MADNRPHTFNKSSAERIAQATRAFEDGDPDNPYRRRRRYGNIKQDPRMFRIERVDDTSVLVRAGYWVRYSVGQDFWVEMDINGGPPPLPPSGTSGDPDYYWEETGISETKYVYAYLDVSLRPVVLTVVFMTSIPQTDAQNQLRAIGKITWDPVLGRIGKVENYHKGIIQNFFCKPGNRSIDYSTISPYDDCLQWRQWDNPDTLDRYTLEDADMFGVRDDSDILLRYIRADELAEWMAAYVSGGGSWPFKYWSDLLDTVGDPLDNNKLGYIPIVTDQDPGPGVNTKLELVSGGPGGSGPWWKLGNLVPGDAYGSVIGDGSAATVIDLVQRILTDPGGVTASVDWANRQLWESTGSGWTQDWDTREFDGEDWTFLSGTICKAADTTPVTTNDTGSIQCKGGINFQKLSGGTDGTRSVDLLADGTGLTTFIAAIAATSTSVEAIIAVGGGWGLYGRGGVYEGYVGDSWNSAAGYFTDSANTTKLCDSLWGINVIAGDCNVGAGGDYYHGGILGDTQNYGANSVFSGGIFVNQDGWAPIAIRAVPAGGGDPIDLVVMGRTI